jgi:hypothetical protein
MWVNQNGELANRCCADAIAALPQLVCFQGVMGKCGGKKRAWRNSIAARMWRELNLFVVLDPCLPFASFKRNEPRHDFEICKSFSRPIILMCCKFTLDKK